MLRCVVMCCRVLQRIEEPLTTTGTPQQSRAQVTQRFLGKSLVFFWLSRPAIGWQKRKTEKAKGPKIPKILQKREI